MKEIKRQEDKKMEGSTGKTVEVQGLMKPPVTCLGSKVCTNFLRAKSGECLPPGQSLFLERQENTKEWRGTG